MNVTDNKLLYEKRFRSTDDDHPLKVEVGHDPVISGADDISKELASVALDWKTLRNIKECGCSTPFDHFSRKVSESLSSRVDVFFFLVE